jgi:hypothetical protein
LEISTTVPPEPQQASAKTFFYEQQAWPRAEQDQPRQSSAHGGGEPFGDDPADQRWIKEGIKHAKFRNY